MQPAIFKWKDVPIFYSEALLLPSPYIQVCVCWYVFSSFSYARSSEQGKIKVLLRDLKLQNRVLITTSPLIVSEPDRDPQFSTTNPRNEGEGLSLSIRRIMAPKDSRWLRAFSKSLDWLLCDITINPSSHLWRCPSSDLRLGWMCTEW